MTTPETLKWSPSSTPSNKPSDALLKNFRATLEQRWKEFNKATLEEAFGIKSVRDSDADFQKAKATFDEAMAALWAIDTDEKLKQILEAPGRLSSTINTLKDYLASADKQKAYNTVLTHTLADLTGLKAQMTERPEDKKAAEVAAVAVTSGAWALLANSEVQGVLEGAKGEMTGEIKKALGPWGMIFRGVKDVPAKEVAIQIKDLSKEYNEKKWMDDPIDKLFAMVKLFFLKWQIGRADMDLSGEMTSEEMKLAGMKEKPWRNKPEERSRETIGEAGKNILYGGAYSGLISFHQNFLAKITGEKNPDENKRKIQAVYAYQSMYNLPYEKAQSLYLAHKWNPNNPDILKELSIDNQSKISSKDVVAALALIVDESLMSTKSLQKNKGTLASITVGEILTASHGDWSIAGDFEKIDPTLSSNPSQVFSQIFGNIGARFSLKKEWNTYRFGNPETQAQAESLGMNAVALWEISTLKININTLQESEIEKLQMDPKTADILKKLIAFWKSVKWPLAENFSFGQKSEYMNFYNTADIAPISLLKLYLVTWWSTDLQSMASPRKMWVYAIIRESLFDGTGANKDFWAAYFDKSIIAMGTAWALNPTDLDKYIPKDVQEAMGNISATIADNVVDSTWWIASRAWMALPTGWKIGAGASVTLGIMIIWRLRALKWIGMWAALGAASAASLFAGAVYAGLSDSDKKKYPKDAIEKWARWGMEKILAKTE